jgi:hypothetical protein
MFVKKTIGFVQVLMIYSTVYVERSCSAGVSQIHEENTEKENNGYCTSFLNEISKGHLGKGVVVSGEALLPPPPRFLQQVSGNIFKDDVSSFSPCLNQKVKYYTECKVRVLAK